MGEAQSLMMGVAGIVKQTGAEAGGATVQSAIKIGGDLKRGIFPASTEMARPATRVIAGRRRIGAKPRQSCSRNSPMIPRAKWRLEARGILAQRARSRRLRRKTHFAQRLD
jgi:hypothetical protein